MPLPKNQTKQKQQGRLIKLLVFKISALVIACIYAFVFIILFCTNFYWVHTRNSKIEGVLTSAITTKAAMVEINTSKHNHHATFIFTANSRTYTGETFQDYDGYKGDSICVTYNTLQPVKNIYCNDAVIETFTRDVLERSAVDALRFEPIIIIVLLGGLLGNKINSRRKLNK